MSGWIKVEKGLTETIRFKRIVRKLRDSSNALRGVTQNPEAFAVTVVLGAIVRFWIYADSHIRDDDTLEITLDEINEIVGVDGFAQALPAEWLQVIDAERVQLPNFLDHNGSSEKQRRDNARRQAEYRHRRDSRNVTRDVTVTNTRNDARPDQTRLDKTRPENAYEASDAELMDAFVVVRSSYPKKSGRTDWLNAEHHWRCRIDEGIPPSQLLAGVERYAKFCASGGVSGSAYVLGPEKFFGAADKPWAQSWDPPKTKAETRLDSNVEVLNKFINGVQ